MAEILISVLLEQLASLAVEKIREKGRQVKNVKKEVAKLTSNLQAINAVLLDAEKRRVEDEAVRGWLEKLQDMSCEIDDALDEWNTVILRFEAEKEEKGEADQHADLVKKVCFFIPSSWFPCVQVRQVGLRLNVSCKIKELNEQIDNLVEEKNKFRFNEASVVEQPEREKTTSFVDVSEVYGRDKEKEILVNNLLCESSQTRRRLSIIPIVGMGGMGKTTLSQLVYNDDQVKAQFPCRIWVCVSEPFDEIKIAKAIIESMTRKPAPEYVELDNFHQQIREDVEGKKFLLVLDDVWTQEDKKWGKLKKTLEHGAAGSRILVTTRKKEVAIMMEAETRMITLESLSDAVCWSIFSNHAFRSGDKSQKLVRKLLESARAFLLLQNV